MFSRDLQIEVPNLAVQIFVLDAEIREVHVLVEVRQVVRARPFLDVLRRAIRSSRAVRIAQISVLEKALVFAFQLAVQLDAEDASILCAQAFGGLQIRAIDRA